MKKKLCLRNSEEFGRVFRRGRSWAHPLLVLYVLPNGLGHNRYGFAASKRVGKATARNRAKRLMREALRLEGDRLGLGWDLVLIARSRTPHASCQEVREALLRLWEQAGLLEKKEAARGESRP